MPVKLARTFRLLPAGLSLGLLWAIGAVAHVFPVRALPAAGATAPEPVPQVQIWFDGALEPGFSKVRVVNAAGEPVDSGDARLNADDPSVLEVSLPPLPPGGYHVYWTAFARDGHATQGDFGFKIR